MSTGHCAALCGLLFGAGLWLIVVRLPFMRAVTLTERVAPQLRAQDTASRLLTTAAHTITPFGPLERIVTPVLRDAVAWLARYRGGTSALQERLARAGSARTSLDFRAVQLLLSGAAFAAVLLVCLLGVLSGRVAPFQALLAALCTAAFVALALEQWLNQRIRSREAKILREFPGLAEMMALAVGAGMNARGAVERLALIAHGELAAEFARTVADARSGTPFLEALRGLARRVKLVPVDRFVDGLIVAMERGTPLSDVLRAQAQDVRDLGKRELMESAGRKEILMMVPVVFGVLPLTVLFAVFPGLAAITLML
ncbi:type II secretion system F family protein [Arthrobacter woluwensis]|uniref:type II secretion system F family protein n=1 Tax=Arthrobacter woluwensis TaxID=156980 RepID=UPI001AAFBCCB|nr:type II secretion system F family protein [Arthrobacter woluwensis]QTF72033.1 type II secretion system F family protein [Arthrobacter woluwensis]